MSLEGIHLGTDSSGDYWVIKTRSNAEAEEYSDLAATMQSANAASVPTGSMPRSYKQAMATLDSGLWKAAAETKMEHH